MKRLNKFIEPRMISGRVEKADADKVADIIGKQVYVSLQDFVNFSVQQFISGNIYISGSSFHIKNS